MTASSPALKVSGVTLPSGEHRDLYVVDGRIRTEPVRDADTVAEGWIVPGLVDAHCHIGLDAHGAVPDETSEQQALTDRDAGTLLVRDAGSAADTRWVDDRDDLPRVIRAGRHIARPKRYIRNYAHEVEPGELTAYVVQEAQRGDGWVKLVGDWIDREAGDLAPLWPADSLQRAIAAAHDHGARVTAHVFGEEALPDLLAAGIDCIEHGTGLTEDLISVMAARGTAVVPTLINVENFPGFAAAGEKKFPAYASTMRRLYAHAGAVVRAAYEAGVPVFAGTDAGGSMEHGLIGAEIRALNEAGLPAEDALAAGSWAARSWLGLPCIEEGAPADVVVYDADPRKDLDTLARPQLMLLRGTVVG
jgi:imidazolonepropionase-like amidohydrolase